MIRRLMLLLAVVLLVVFPAAAQDEGTVVIAPGDPIVIGVATIRSGEGLVPLGDDILRGVELAVDARPVVTVGDVEFEIELDVQDDQCSQVGGQAVANYYVSAPEVAAVVGPTCSSACRAAGPIFDGANYTMISSSCTAPDLTDAETGFTSFNRTTPNDAAQGAEAASFIYNTLGFTQIATIHDGSPYGEGLVKKLTESFVELGGEVVFADSVGVGETDFRALLNQVAEGAPELIYFGGFPQEAARLIEQRNDVGLGEVPFMGADGINTPELINLAGELAEGVYASSPVATASDALAEFIAAYEEKYDTEPTAAFHAYAYDATNMILDAIEAVGTLDDDGNLVIDRAELAEYIRAYGADEAVAGLSGDLVCDGTGDCAVPTFGFFQVTEGAYSRLEIEETMEEEATE